MLWPQDITLTWIGIPVAWAHLQYYSKELLRFWSSLFIIMGSSELNGVAVTIISVQWQNDQKGSVRNFSDENGYTV